MQAYGLSDVLIEEILSWLPVKSLIRFKCVSKNWHSIITSSHFEKLHLKRSTKQNSPENNDLSIIVSPTSTYRSYVDAILVGDQLTHHRFLNDIGFDCNYFNISESCNGLVCIRLLDKYTAQDDRFLLYNPATGALRHLPTLPIPQAITNLLSNDTYFISCGFFGFGYDDISDDYKVIRIVRDVFFGIVGEDTEIHVNIFSLTNNCWSTIQNIRKNHYYLLKNLNFHKSCGAVANNALHWISSPDKIIGIDFHNREFRLLQLPNVETDCLYMNLNGHEGCLNFTVEHRRALPSTSKIDRAFPLILDLWRMKESWSKWVSVVLQTSIVSVSRHRYITVSHFASVLASMAVGYSTSQHVVAFVLKDGTTDGTLKLFYRTPEKNVIEVEMNAILSSYPMMIPFVPSLVSFD